MAADTIEAVIPTNSGRYLNLAAAAFQKNKEGKHNERQFYALCGANPPTITAGYGKWNVVDRPLRQGVTIPTGFDPAKLHVQLLFGVWDGRFNFSGWDKSKFAGQAVEQDIDDLHWMAGGNSLGGPSPNIYIWSGKRDNQTRLVPKQYWNVGWVVTGGITWGQSWRNRFGDRIYQEAEFDLLGYSGVKNPGPKIKSVTDGGYFTTTAAVRTAYGIAAAQSSHSSADNIEILARRILAQGRNNPCHGSRVKLERRSVHWKMPIHLKVWVPQHHV